MRTVTQAGVLPAHPGRRAPAFGSGDGPEQPNLRTTTETVRVSNWSLLNNLRLKMAKPMDDVPAATRVLNRLATDLVKSNGIQQPIRVCIVDQPSCNGRALSNGVIMVHAGLLKQAISPEEVAFVLAHEISHRQLAHHEHHSFEFGVAALGSLFTGHTMRRFLSAGANSIGAWGRLAVCITPWILPMQWLSKQHRGHEMQADLNAIQLLTKAGYSPLGYQTLMARTAYREENRTLVSKAYAGLLGRSHPPVIVRKTALAQRIQTEPNVNASRPIMSPEDWQVLKQAVGSVDDE